MEASNNKSQLSILEEHPDNQQSMGKHEIKESSEKFSSEENVNEHKLNGKYTQSSSRLADIPEPSANNFRRPSVVLQEIFRKQSQSILPYFRSRRGTIQEDALPPPAIESMRKNRRIGK